MAKVESTLSLGGSGSTPNLQQVTDVGNTTTNDIILDGTFKKVKSPDGKKALEIGPDYTRIFAYAGDNGFPDTEARVQVETNGGVLIQGESTQINIKEGSITGQDGTFRGLEYATDYSLNFTDRSLVDKGYVDGEVAQKADLVGGKVPSTQLPSYVDDVVEAANFAALPVTGESGKIYITLDNNKTYRWSGSTYVELSSPQIPEALGLIKIVDKAGDFFTDLATASTYIRTFTSATITDESFSNGTFWFTVPNGSSFGLTTLFLGNNSTAKSAYIVDELGLITTFGTSFGILSSGNHVFGNATFGTHALDYATGKSTFGNCTFGDGSFEGFSGISEFKNILLSGTSNYFARVSTGLFKINGNIGTTNANNYTNFFTTTTAVIWALKAKETSNAGGIEGDLATAQTNGAKLFFGYATSGGGSGDMTKAVYDTDDDGVVDSAKKEIVNFINKSGATITKGTIVYLKTSSSSSLYPEVLKANAATEATSSKTIGAVFEDVLNDGIGYIVTSGEVRNLDTSSYVIGDKLWLSTTDGLVTTTVPTQPNHAVFIGTVTRAQSVNGRVLYAIQNGYEIEELHNVSNVSYNPAIDTDSLLIKDVTNSLWKRFTIANLKALILGTPLTGLSTLATTQVTATDSIVVAIGELQGQLNTKQTWIVKDSTPTSAVTGTTSLTQIGATITIPANTFSANDILMFNGYGIEKTGTAGTCIFRLYHNTSNTLTGANVLAAATIAAANISGNMRRTFEINGGLLTCRFSGSSGFTDYAGNSGSIISISFDPTITNYFLTTVLNASAADSVVRTHLLMLK